MDKAIEAAARAWYAKGVGYLSDDEPEFDALDAEIKQRLTDCCSAAIAAYQAASGEAREIRAYRHIRDRMAKEGTILIMMNSYPATAEEADEAIEAAIAAREGENDE